MSSKKIEKKPKKFYSYDATLSKLKEISNLINRDESEIINAALVFFLDSPEPIQKSIYLHFHKRLAEAAFPGGDVHNDEELFESIRTILKKGSV